MLQPLNKDILFIFTDAVKNKLFQETTDWGLKIIEDQDRSAKRGRWAKIVAVGPDVDREEIPPSGYIYVEPLMWSVGFSHENVKVWKTDASKVMLVSADRPQ